MPDWREQVADELVALEHAGVVDGIWRRDPAVWAQPSPGGTPAEDATGWLDLPGQVADRAAEVSAFVDEVRSEGFEDVVLLGMGGSSLGPHVLQQVFGTSPGFLRVHVLDSTVPGQIRAVQAGVDLSKTLVLVSSKSGTTLEPLALAAYFRNEIGSAGVDNPDGHFIAVTDPGTPLQVTAAKRGFRRVFSGSQGVGGRFSVLSNFGVVPAALAGVDLDKVSASASAMAATCGPNTPVYANPGAVLGATLGALAAGGRDKVTILTSNSLSAFGLWAEQLLAESTGKNGRGLIPVTNEPIRNANDYGADRNFVYVRLADDENRETDDFALALERAGHPVATLDLEDPHDIGGEFFRWEFAVAVAATAIDVYPFDQPDVESGKAITRQLLEKPDIRGRGPASLPVPTDLNTLIGTVCRAKPGDYVAILGYFPETNDTANAVSLLRTAITNRTGVATTFGYGPRYLHSTGQLHKGGPDSAIGLALVAGNEEALAAIGADGKKGSGYGFESLFMAQVMGDMDALRSVGRRHAVAALQHPYTEAIREIAGLIDPASQ